MLRFSPIIPVLLLVTACQQGEEGADAPEQSAESQASGTEEGETGTQGREEKIENDLYEFGYSYPSAAGAIPGLAQLLDKRLERAKSELEASAESDKQDAEANSYPYRAHSRETTWQVVADLPGWLSLSAQSYTYSGGAHGMTFFDSLLWNKSTREERDVVSLFVSEDALREAIREPFCDALDREREERRERPVDRGSGDEFDKCIDPLESTAILGSSNGKTFDRIGVLVEPYAAGPYAEGTFDITVPVTDSVMDVVKPAYRGSFSVAR